MTRLVAPSSTAVIDVSDELVGLYTTAGWKAEEVEEEGGAPKGNASLEKWVEYALSEGKTAEDLNGLTRDEVRALFAD